MESKLNVINLKVLLELFMTSTTEGRDAASVGVLEDAGLVHEVANSGAVIHAEVTDRGVFFIKMLKDTPLPEQRYVDPRTWE